MNEILAPLETIQVWPPGKLLFREGEPATGVYVIHSGEIEICFADRPLLSARPGQILGLASVVGNKPLDSSATTRTDCITGFVDTGRFLRLLDEKPQLWIDVLRLISSSINACWDCMRSLR